MDSNCNSDTLVQEGMCNVCLFYKISMFFFAGILVTGGHNSVDNPYFISEGSVARVRTLVEIIRADGSTCTMPELELPGRYSHTQTSFTACGGVDITSLLGGLTSCSTFTAGEWLPSHTLSSVGRMEHVAWQSPNGTLLLGGRIAHGEDTAELLSTTTDTTSATFTVPYPTL